jgi:hypothetical protein
MPRCVPCPSKVLLAAALVMACAGGLSACTENSAPPPAVPEELSRFAAQLEKTATGFERKDGGWTQHYGDAPFYGVGFFARMGAPGPTDPAHADSRREGRADYRAIAEEGRQYNLKLLQMARGNTAFLLENLEEVMMATLGLIELAAVEGKTEPPAEAESTLDTLNAFTVGLGHYIDTDAGMFAIKTYGPTAITAAVALVNVQYTTYFHTELSGERLKLAQKIVKTIDEKAWDGSRYLVKPGDPMLELYPHAMMMAVLSRLYQQTGEAAYLSRAEAAFAAIGKLRSARGGYLSPYSAATMGAKTDDYSTLSSQNYLTLALLLMSETHTAVGKIAEGRAYLDEALFVLDFVRTKLFSAAEAKLLHHYIDGRLALPTDPEYFCAGCNLQFLYVVWHLREQTLAGA